MPDTTTPFGGKIGRDWRESTPWWPTPERAREGAPNVVYVVLDDVGYAQLGCYGSDIETPNIDRLAKQGLQYTNFHTTALCSPTRACLLTGRNHHSNGMATIIELASGFPGYTCQIPKSSAFVSEVLTRNGYAAYAVGKWHLTPASEMHMGAPRDRWPLGRGFERFYGFIGAETHQYTPALIYDNHEVDPPATYEEGYHLTNDITDKSIEFIRDLRAGDHEKPFFLYFAPGACHAPHQAPKEWIEKYRGRFDEGWDSWRQRVYERQQREGIIPEGTQLSERPHWVAAWDSLTDDEKTVYARMMEVFAGFLSHTDDQIGRLLSFIDDLGELENTMVVLISDNGASAEGGPHGSVNEMRFFNAVPESMDDNMAGLDELGGPLHYNHYSWGWAWAGNSPLKRWKRETHEGGVLDPMIVCWPKGIEPGGVRRQFTHAIDITPTVLEAIGAEKPAAINGVSSEPMQGKSFAYTFSEPDAPGRHVTQYFEMMGSRGIYHDGWKAVTYHPILGVSYDGTDGRKPFDEDVWELYNVAKDASECNDLADEDPRKLRDMIDRWWAEAGKYQVLPIDNRGMRGEIPTGAPKRERFVYKPGGGSLPGAVAPNLKGRTHYITVECVVDESTNGVLVAHGAYFGGYSLLVRDRKLHYVYNYVGVEEYWLSSEIEIPEGKVTLGFEYLADEKQRFRGQAALFINGKKVGERELPRTIPIFISLAGEGFCVGYDGGLPVSREYVSPFTFTGVMRRLTIDVTGAAYSDPAAEERVAMGTQ